MQQVVVVTDENGKFYGVFKNERFAERSADFSYHKMNVVKTEKYYNKYTVTVRDENACERQFTHIFRIETVYEEIVHL